MVYPGSAGKGLIQYLLYVELMDVQVDLKYPLSYQFIWAVK